MDHKHISTKNKLETGLTFKITRFKEQIKKTRPHKHDEYYELIFLEEGEGFHTIEAEKYLVAAPDFYFLKPGQLHYWEFTAIPKGFVVLLKKNEFDLLREPVSIELLRKLSEKTRIRLAPGGSVFILLDEMAQEYYKHTFYSKEIIQGLLKALMARLLQLSKTNSDTSAFPLGSFDRFNDLLVKECPKMRKVHQFADALNMTPQNLTSICRKQTGKSASELIATHVMLEAKRYLLHTDITINEIAEIMSFSDTSNFVKFFRKNEGFTPVQFRGQYFQ